MNTFIIIQVIAGLCSALVLAVQFNNEGNNIKFFITKSHWELSKFTIVGKIIIGMLNMVLFPLIVFINLFLLYGYILIGIGMLVIFIFLHTYMFWSHLLLSILIKDHDMSKVGYYKYHKGS